MPTKEDIDLNEIKFNFCKKKSCIDFLRYAIDINLTFFVLMCLLRTDKPNSISSTIYLVLIILITLYATNFITCLIYPFAEKIHKRINSIKIIKAITAILILILTCLLVFQIYYFASMDAETFYIPDPEEKYESITDNNKIIHNNHDRYYYEDIEIEDDASLYYRD